MLFKLWFKALLLKKGLNECLIGISFTLLFCGLLDKFWIIFEEKLKILLLLLLLSAECKLCWKNWLDKLFWLLEKSKFLFSNDILLLESLFRFILLSFIIKLFELVLLMLESIFCSFKIFFWSKSELDLLLESSLIFNGLLLVDGIEIFFIFF